MEALLKLGAIGSCLSARSAYRWRGTWVVTAAYADGQAFEVEFEWPVHAVLTLSAEGRGAMIKGRIAIPDKNPKTWRAPGRKRKPAQAVPVVMAGVKSPQEIMREKRRKRVIGEG